MRGRKFMFKWLNGKDEVVKDDVDEVKIFKVCLYKI